MTIYPCARAISNTLTYFPGHRFFILEVKTRIARLPAGMGPGRWLGAPLPPRQAGPFWPSGAHATTSAQSLPPHNPLSSLHLLFYFYVWRRSESLPTNDTDITQQLYHYHGRSKNGNFSLANTNSSFLNPPSPSSAIVFGFDRPPSVSTIVVNGHNDSILTVNAFRVSHPPPSWHRPSIVCSPPSLHPHKGLPIPASTLSRHVPRFNLIC
ncbi:hypothetical protein C8Q79DRAFT_440622 [Trametes meyenii]|nr:hypothetical protein C8Q79DRAFT_440622 [Trametes meyenii]